MRFDGSSLLGVRPHAIAAQGIGRSLQSTHYFADMTVLNLVALGGLRNTVLGALRYSEHRRRRGSAASGHRALEVLDQLGLAGGPPQQVMESEEVRISYLGCAATG